MDTLGAAMAVAIGSVMGITGSGGSILTVPLFVYILGLPPVLATGYSLFVVGISASFGALAYHRRRLIDLGAALTFAPPSLAGVYLVRRHVIHSLPETLWTTPYFVLTKDHFIMTAFALLMLMSAHFMVRDARRPLRAPAPGPQGPRRLALIAAEGLFVGAATGFLGAGGGFLIVPALVLLSGLPMETAVGTSLVIVAAKSLAGFAGDLAVLEAIDWKFLGGFSAASLVGTVLGSLLARRLDGRRLQAGFGLFLYALGGAVLIREIIQLIPRVA